MRFTLSRTDLDVPLQPSCRSQLVPTTRKGSGKDLKMSVPIVRTRVHGRREQRWPAEDKQTVVYAFSCRSVRETKRVAVEVLLKGNGRRSSSPGWPTDVVAPARNASCATSAGGDSVGELPIAAATEVASRAHNFSRTGDGRRQRLECGLVPGFAQRFFSRAGAEDDIRQARRDPAFERAPESPPISRKSAFANIEAMAALCRVDVGITSQRFDRRSESTVGH